MFNREVTHQTSEGKVTYLAKMSGEHQICISCESSQVRCPISILSHLSNSICLFDILDFFNLVW